MNNLKAKDIISRIKKLLYEKFFKINDAPQKIALGLGIGVFSGILPGTGPIAALFLALIFKANRASALAASLLTNTWISLLTFLLAIKTGSVIFKISWQSLKADWSSAIEHWHWQHLFSLPILKMLLPVIIGYIIIAFCLGLIVYILALALLILARKFAPNNLLRR